MLHSVNPETKASSRKSNNNWPQANVINTRKYPPLQSKRLSSPSGRLIASEQELQLANDWLYYITYYALNEHSSPPPQVSTQIKTAPASVATRKDQPRKSRTEIEDFHFKDAVNTYQQLEKEEIMCKNCQQQSKKVNSFGYHDGYICMNCAAKAYSRISELVDWEEIVENGRGIQCDRLRHQKKLSSFIKFENKTGTYKRVKLCIFCRNVKRWEYSRKSLFPTKPHSPTSSSGNINNVNNNGGNINLNMNMNNNINTSLISPKRRKVDELIPILPRPDNSNMTIPIPQPIDISNNNNNNNNQTIPLPQQAPPPLPQTIIQQQPLPIPQSMVLSNIIPQPQQQQQSIQQEQPIQQPSPPIQQPIQQEQQQIMKQQIIQQQQQPIIQEQVVQQQQQSINDNANDNKQQ